MDLEKIDRLGKACHNLGIELIIIAESKACSYLLDQPVAIGRNELVVFVAETEEVFWISDDFTKDRSPLSGITLIQEANPEQSFKGVLRQMNHPAKVAMDASAIKKMGFMIDRMFPDCNFVPAEHIIQLCRRRKTAKEVESLKKASAVADRVMEKVFRNIATGMTEVEMARRIDAWLNEAGINKTYFRTIVASGPNSGDPTHKSGTRVLADGDVIIVDYGGPLAGYNCDLTRTLILGKQAPDELVKVYQTVLQAFETAFTTVKPGVMAKTIDLAARKVIGKAGFGKYFPHPTGHGIGLDGHEDPVISAASHMILEPGMVISLEPGIYLPGNFGVRLEDIIVLTENGPEYITRQTKVLQRR